MAIFNSKLLVYQRVSLKYYLNISEKNVIKPYNKCFQDHMIIAR